MGTEELDALESGLAKPRPGKALVNFEDEVWIYI